MTIGDAYGVRWIPNYRMMSAEPFRPGGLLGGESPIRDLIPELRDLAPGEHPFPFPHVRRFDTMLIEPHRYLEGPPPRLPARRQARLGERRPSRPRTRSWRCRSRPVINCTGLGAKALFSDPELTPVKGQLTFLLPQPEVDYITLGDDLYMFPRHDGILLGGTWERGVSTLEPDLAARNRILAARTPPSSTGCVR